MNGSDIKFQTEENISWENKNFNVFGINYSLSLNQIINLYYIEKIADIKALLQQWSKEF
jgi:hypothetical protein